MKKIEKLFISAFVLILFVFMIFTITNNDTISNVEKRTLKTFPKFSLNNLNNYFDEVTEAFNDQLFLRNKLIKGYYLFQFQRYLGDVVVGKDNEMFSSIQKEDKNYVKKLKNVTKSINEVNKEITSLGAKFVFVSIPRKDAVMEEYLPNTYTSSKNIYLKGKKTIKKNLDESILWIDAYDLFKESDKKCYFKTDHHININGSSLILNDLLNKTLNINYDVNDYFSIKSTYINGSFNKQIGQSKDLVKEDLYLTLKNKISYKRYENGTESNLSVWGKGTTYETAYMSGDKAETVIETNRKDKPNILFVGSSFTNILESMSIPVFNRMVSIDYRHNTSGKSISDYVKEYDIDYVIFIPSQSTNALSPDQIKLHLGLN